MEGDRCQRLKRKVTALRTTFTRKEKQKMGFLEFCILFKGKGGGREEGGQGGRNWVGEKVKSERKRGIEKPRKWGGAKRAKRKN